jgi:N-acetylneuraminic acid mutarotase
MTEPDGERRSTGDGDCAGDQTGDDVQSRPPRRRARARRIARSVALAAAGTLAAIVLWVALLIVTNPDPRRTDVWGRLADMPGGRGEVASAVVGDRLVVLGGLHGPGRTSRTVTAYDPAEDRWERLPDLPDPRHHAAAAGLDGAVYVTGGSPRATDWGPRDQLWRLRPDALGWDILEPMPEGRLGHDMVALDGRLYVVGGDGPGSDVLVHEPGRGWERGAALGSRPDHIRAVVLDGEVWAIGGRTDALGSAVSIYDPAADRWRDGPALPYGMSAMAVGVLDGAVHVVGGEDPDLLGGRVHDRHLVLAPGAEAWEPGPEPVLAVHGAGYGVLPDRGGTDALIIAGGARRQGVLSVLSWTGLTQEHRPDAVYGGRLLQP